VKKIERHGMMSLGEVFGIQRRVRGLTESNKGSQGQCGSEGNVRGKRKRAVRYRMAGHGKSRVHSGWGGEEGGGIL